MGGMIGRRPYIVQEKSRGPQGRVHNSREVLASSVKKAKELYIRQFRVYPTSIIVAVRKDLNES